VTPDASELTLVDAAAAIAGGRTTSRAVVEACLRRIETFDPQLNAFVDLRREQALARAEAADAAIARGETPGPLHGVPLAHKDMFYQAGQVSTCGSRVRAGFVAGQTSTLLTRLDAAGAIDLGTLNMAEFALGPTGHNAWRGDCRNAWNPAHVSGGSSSGSAVAVAARFACGSLGSDTGGSVRLPAAANGLVGLKPTYGRLSRHGMMGLAWSMDVAGLLTRTARDCARVLSVVAGADPSDPTTTRLPVPDYERHCARGVEDVRIGVPRQHFYEHATPEIRKLMQASLVAFESLGARVVEVDVPDGNELTELGRAVVYSEATALHGEWLRHRRGDYSPQVAVRAASGLGIPAPVYLEALALRPMLLRRFVTEVFGACDLLHTPTLPIPVPTRAETDVGSGAAMWDIIARFVHCTGPVNYLGLPAVAVPAGFTANGLPASFQLIGRPFAEAALLGAAHAYEQVTDWTRRAPHLSAVGCGAQAT